MSSSTSSSTLVTSESNESREIDALADALERVRVHDDGVAREWHLETHGYVRVTIESDRSMELRYDVRPGRAEFTRVRVRDPAAPRELCASYERSLERARHEICGDSSGEALQQLRRQARRADVQHLLRVHNQRLQDEPRSKPVPVATVRGCLLRLLELVLGGSRDSNLRVSVQYRGAERALVVCHGNPRVQEVLYPIELYNRDRPSGHLVGAVIPMMLKNEREYDPSEVMRVISTRWAGRAILYWAEVDCVDPRDRAIEIKTRINRNDHLADNLLSAGVQSILAGIDEMWFYTHWSGRVVHADRMAVPKPGSAEAFVPRVADFPPSDPRIRRLPQTMPLALDRLEVLFAQLLTHAERQPDEIFHVNVLRSTEDHETHQGAPIYSLTFNESDFDTPQAEYHVRAPSEDRHVRRHE